MTLKVARDADRLTIAVSDTGIGISAEDQGPIFDEFVQVGSAAPGGAGLGLAVTRQIVHAQGGRVGVSSRPGLGSTFYAWLPCTVADEHRPEARPALSRQRRLTPARRLGGQTGGVYGRAWRTSRRIPLSHRSG